MIIKEECK